ncbi:hypothetical protein BgiBS90_024716 [Biomphalaria glabrata]|nr:hypothetical protein BgiBS90_024716 [Biomphalaria glabrata]
MVDMPTRKPPSRTIARIYRRPATMGNYLKKSLESMGWHHWILAPGSHVHLAPSDEPDSRVRWYTVRNSVPV